MTLSSSHMLYIRDIALEPVPHFTSYYSHSIIFIFFLNIVFYIIFFYMNIALTCFCVQVHVTQQKRKNSKKSRDLE